MAHISPSFLFTAEDRSAAWVTHVIYPQPLELTNVQHNLEFSSSVTPAAFQVPSGHLWPVASRVDRTEMNVAGPQEVLLAGTRVDGRLPPPATVRLHSFIRSFVHSSISIFTCLAVTKASARAGRQTTHKPVAQRGGEGRCGESEGTASGSSGEASGGRLSRALRPGRFGLRPKA